MSGRVRPRRRRREPAPERAAVVEGAEPIRAEERVDLRVALVAPSEVVGDPEALLGWAERHHPEAVLTDNQVGAHRNALTRSARWQEACRYARRRGVPEPRLAEFMAATEPS
jgi:hypothetical protein